jgi:hypothetical protein
MTTITVLDSTGATQTIAKVANTGQTTSTNSLPVVIANDQSSVPVTVGNFPATQPVSAAALPLPTLAATSTKQSDGSQLTQITGSAAQAAAGIVASVSAQGYLGVVGAVTRLFFDTFDAALDTTNTWTVSGTTLPAAVNGEAVLDLTAANSVSSVLVSIPTFISGSQLLRHGAQLGLGSAQSNPNVHRFWGRGVVTSYVSATPLTNGHGYEVDLTGALNAVVYIGGTRYVVNSTNPALITSPGSWAPNMVMQTYGSTMTWPASGVAIFSTEEANGVVFFFSNTSSGGLGVPLGFAIYTPAVTTLPIRAAAISTPAVSTVLATTFRVTGESFGVINGTNNTLSDPTFPWRQQAVDTYGRALGVSPDVFATGVAAQTVSGNNILLTAAGTTSIDTQAVGARSISIQIVPTGTVSSGVVTFEGSHDNTTFVALPLYDTASLTANPVTTVSPATGVSRYFSGNTAYRYIRARISTVIGGGGSIQAFYTLSQLTFVPTQTAVTQATAANLNATAVIASGTVTTVSTVTTLTTLANGQTAHSAASTGSPVRVAGRVNTAVDTTLVTGDVSDLFMTTAGQLVEKPYAAPELDWQATSGITALATTTSTALKAAGAAGVRNYVTALQLYNTSATVSTTASILDGATVIWTGYLPATTAALPVVDIHAVFPTPLRGTAATAMNIQLGTTGAAVYYNVQGYQAP